MVNYLLWYTVVSERGIHKTATLHGIRSTRPSVDEEH